MDFAISYINDRGEYKLAQVPEKLADSVITYDEGIDAYTYVHPINKTTHLLHSQADRPGLVENDGRTHWFWKGRLHRIQGPAFTCKGNQEWYVFGIMTDEYFVEKYKDYLLCVEALAMANGVDLHGLNLDADGSRYFLNFKSEIHIADCIDSNVIPICDRETGDLYTCNLDELNLEIRAEEKGPGLLVAAVLGAAAAFAATRIKKKMAEVAAEKTTKQHQVANA